jgi:hypothetical protein
MHHFICRNITIRINKFPVPFGTGKKYAKKGIIRTSKRKADIWISQKSSRLGQIWVKRGFEGETRLLHIHTRMGASME